MATVWASFASSRGVADEGEILAGQIGDQVELLFERMKAFEEDFERP